MRSHVQVKWDEPASNEWSSILAQCLAGIESRPDMLWDARLPNMIRAYFEDWSRLLSTLRGRARDDGSLWIVVSTSAYAGIEVPVDLILAEMALPAGWFLREIGVLRHLRSAGQHWHKASRAELSPLHLRESVVILDAKPR